MKRQSMVRACVLSGVVVALLCGGCDEAETPERDAGNDASQNATGPLLFSPSFESSFSDGAQVVSLGDLDGDGDLDALLGTQRGASVWLNDGAGRFVAGQQLLETVEDLWVEEVALGDLDNDGDLDAVVSAPDQPIWLNDGAGVFTRQDTSFDYSGIASIALGDLDLDGDLDLLLTVNGRDAIPGIQLWLNDGQGAFSAAAERLGPLFTRGVEPGDLDNDGDLDAFLIISGDSEAPDDGDRVWINDGSGALDDSGQLLTAERMSDLGDVRVDVALEDVDRDGDLDAFVVGVETNHIWLNDGAGVFSDSGQQLEGPDSRAVTLGDVDGDGDLDALIVSFFPGESSLWRNDGQGGFSRDPSRFSSQHGSSGALGDIDGDGDLDVLIGEVDGRVQVFLNETASP